MLIRIFDNEGAKQDELASMLYLDKAVVTRTVNLLQEKASFIGSRMKLIVGFVIFI